jgi:hypothetical protein
MGWHDARMMETARLQKNRRNSEALAGLFNFPRAQVELGQFFLGLVFADYS